MVANLITNQQKEQFQEEGYFILESVIPSSSLSILRDTCDRLVEETDAELEKEDNMKEKVGQSIMWEH